ncbi:MAG: hypothetical protein ABJL67_21500 [Sulfitobacter sp.]
MEHISAQDLRAFMVGKTLHAFDPDSGERVASVTYMADGACVARFVDGIEDRGQYGLSGDTYWTKYTDFRAGQISEFYLVEVADQVAQAYHTDGRRAYLQSPLIELEEGAA